MFHTFLRDNQKRIYRSFSTIDNVQAMNAFETLIYRKDLDGMKIIAMLKYKKITLAFHRFDVDENHKNHIRGKTLAIYKNIVLLKT